MWLTIGFAALGFLIGNLVGLTAESVVTQTISLLFAAMGGSLVVLLKGLSADDRRLAGQMVLCLSAMALIGVLSGILVSEYRLLSPTSAGRSADNKYLRTISVSEVAAIDLKYNERVITSDEAYKALRSLLMERQTAERER